MNSAGEFADRRGIEIAEWICFDAFHSLFAEWMYVTPSFCRKWVYSKYIENPNLFGFLPGHADYESHKHKNVRFYEVNEPFKLDPVIVDGPIGSILDNHEFTLLTAVSLAVGLGYDDIHLRGVSFQGGRWDGNNADPKIDRLYAQQAHYFQVYMLPMLKARGVRLVNDSKNAQYYFNDKWEMVAA